MVPASPTNALGKTQLRAWRCSENGGVNVLYCYLQVYGIRCEYKALIRQKSEDGASQETALTLKRLSAKNGLALEPTSMTMAELISCPKPVIVHVDGETPDAGAFMLVVSFTPKNVIVLNGATASMHSISREDFRRTWSGVALLSSASGRGNASFAFAFTIGLAVPLLGGFIRRRTLSRTMINLMRAGRLVIAWTLSIVLVQHLLKGQEIGDRSAKISDLPQEAREQLNKQAAAMQNVFLMFTEVLEDPQLINYGGPGAYSIYLDGEKFYQRSLTQTKSFPRDHEDEIAFDGQVLFSGGLTKKSEARIILTKYLVSDPTDWFRTFKLWDLKYLDAAGFYAPLRMSELVAYSGVKPLVLYYFNISSQTTVEKVAENLRLSFLVPDRLVTAALQLDLNAYEQYLVRRRVNTNFLAAEIGMYRRLRSLPTERNVTFILDPKHGYGIAERTETSPSGRRIADLHTDAWKFFDSGGIWLPSRCITLSYVTISNEFSETPTRTSTIDLKSAEFGHKNIEFSRDGVDPYTNPGATIVDRTSSEARTNWDHQVSYSVAADGRLLRESALAVPYEASHGRYWIILLAALGIPPAVLFLHKLLRSRRR
jgi:hypothetical protein